MLVVAVVVVVVVLSGERDGKDGELVDVGKEASSANPGRTTSNTNKPQQRVLATAPFTLRRRLSIRVHPRLLSKYVRDTTNSLSLLL